MSVLALVVALVAAIVLTADASAHAFLDRSDPAANSVVATAPAAAQLWFTEPLEPSYSLATLFDVEGEEIETPPSEVDADDSHLMTLPLPADLPDGTYTISWRNISSADGHPAEGYFSFTVGSSNDLQLPAPPATVGFGGPPTGVAAVGNWLTLLGIMSVLGLLVTAAWIFEIESPIWNRIWGVMRWLVIIGVGVGLIGSVIDLIDQTLSVSSSFSFSAMMDLIRSSSFGQLWLARVAGLGVVIAGLLLLTRRDRSPKRFDRWLLTIFALLPIGAISLNSHASAIEAGRQAATVADFAHIVAGGAWIGGLIAIGTVLISLRSTESDIRQQSLAVVLPRFSTLFIASVIVIVLSGFYASWLQVGNLTALTETDYGRALIVKVALVLGMAGLGAINLLYLEPRLQRGHLIASQLRRTVRTEVVIGIVVLLATGLLISLPTARGAIEAESGQITEALSDDGLNAVLTISPGAVGANRFTVDIQAGTDLPDGSIVLLRVQPEDKSVGGLQEITLDRGGERRFESLGSQLSVVGEWDVEVILRRPSTADWRVASTIGLGTAPPTRNVPSEAPRFDGLLGAISATLLFLAIPALVICLRLANRQSLTWVAMQVMFVSLAGLLISMML